MGIFFFFWLRKKSSFVALSGALPQSSGDTSGVPWAGESSQRSGLLGKQRRHTSPGFSLRQSFFRMDSEATPFPQYSSKTSFAFWYWAWHLNTIPQRRRGDSPLFYINPIIFNDQIFRSLVCTGSQEWGSGICRVWGWQQMAIVLFIQFSWRQQILQNCLPRWVPMPYFLMLLLYSIVWSYLIDQSSVAGNREHYQDLALTSHTVESNLV